MTPENHDAEMCSTFRTPARTPVNVEVLMKRLALLAVLLLAACSSSDYDDPSPQSMPRRGGMGGGGMDGGGMERGQGRMAAGSSLLELLPPADWWHDPQITEPVKLTSEQVTALDKIGSEQGDPVTRMERDSVAAIRDLRTTLDGAQSTQDEIVAAGQRLRALRDDLFGRQVLLLAAERAVLSQQQWRSLQDALQSMRRPQNRMNNGGGRRGGMGGGRGGRRGGGWGGM
jgi:hypothetical protein